MKTIESRVSLIVVLMLAVFFSSQVYPQLQRPRPLRNSYTAEEEIVSMTKTFPLNKALEIFNDISKKFLGKIIIDPENHTEPIGFNIDKMHWIDAMELILRTNNLWYQEYEDYIKIIPLSEATGQTTGQGEKVVNFNTREVTISAVFFEVNESKLRQAGMSWNFFRDKDVNLGISNSSVDARSGLFQVDFSPDWDFADIMAVFKSLESDQIGEIIANPQITVQSGEEGRIQVGSDIAVTVQDFAGNSVTQFFSTGTIIKVTPTVLSKDTIPFTNLDLQVERSSSTGGETQGLEIQKTTAETALLLLDGEETVIGGLYTNQKTNTREGVPFLKDLPWWFFGLRWVFGFESKNVVKKELLMLLKADLLPTLSERLAKKQLGEKQHLLMEKSKELRKQFDYYERQYKVGKQR